MRIGLYGLPTAGKSYILDRITDFPIMHGSTMLHELFPDFDTASENERNEAREKLARELQKKISFIMDGHYAFGSKIVFTEADGILYDAILYLHCDTDILYERMAKSKRNKKYLEYDLASWQKNEIDSLRDYCHHNNKDFYVLDNPPFESFEDVNIILDFISDVVNGYSNVRYAMECANTILSESVSSHITLTDGDKSLINEDSSSVAFDYKTRIFDGNYYTGFQVWRQMREFHDMGYHIETPPAVTLNKRIQPLLTLPVYVVTSGHPELWDKLAMQYGYRCFTGEQMSADTKFFIVKFLKNAGCHVTYIGDSMSDYYAICHADQGYIVTRKDGSISRSFNEKKIEGVNYV